jgi:hypothetical protein
MTTAREALQQEAAPPRYTLDRAGASCAMACRL